MPLSPARDARRDAVVEPLDRLVLERRARAAASRRRPRPPAPCRAAADSGTPSRNRMRLDQLVGVLHLRDGLFTELLGEALVAPVAEHLRVDEVLIDRGELRREHVVQQLDDGVVASHVMTSGGAGYRLTSARERAQASADAPTDTSSRSTDAEQLGERSVAPAAVGTGPAGDSQILDRPVAGRRPRPSRPGHSRLGSGTRTQA